MNLQTNIVEEKIDNGILSAVKVLRDHGFETFESCEGGSNHAFAEATVFFYGDQYDCLRAYEICENHNFNVDHVGIIFQKEVTKKGSVWNRPFCRITFTKHPETGNILCLS